jgi:(S)-ureidoglycine aminohydrolase
MKGAGVNKVRAEARDFFADSAAGGMADWRLMNSRLGLTRNVIRSNYALITSDGYVPSVLPGWTRCAAFVLIAAALGARLGQWLIEMEKGGCGRGATGLDEMFFFIESGCLLAGGTPIDAGGFVYLPPEATYDFECAEPARVLVFKKRYERLDGAEVPAPIVGHERDAPQAPFLGDPHARLKTLLPESPAMDMAVNIFTYDPGATLPFVETHVMEHGMLFLSGSGVYRLGDDWHPVTAGDAIWIAPYCPQWFIAAGQGAQYIYYKDVNRAPV